MKLIVGLGNVGKKYNNTRHNVGFELLDYLGFKEDVKKEDYSLWRVKSNDVDLIVLKPLKFMNLSGEVVKKVANYYNIKISDILIIQDDKDMELGKIKIVTNSTSGGHNGITNIIHHLKTNDIKRIKIGIGNGEIDTTSYVLGHFTKMEKEKIINTFSLLSDLLIDFANMSLEQLQHKYNNRGVSNE
ncbi:MAG: aminoacyl-tRNA hydrolase [bacterium]|nr:aminoacyl-tRNA hydrolase [bacterium]